APLYVQNTRAHINEVVIPETRAVFVDDLKQSEDIWKNETINAISNQISGPATRSTVTEEEYTRFANGQITGNDAWFKTFLSILDPSRPNSPATSYRINRNILAQREAQAEQYSLQEINSGQGYLPVRQCAEYTAD